MACEIGQNIYKLRKKNKELLDILESNSALLENKIKMLRHTTRSPKKPDDLKNIVPSSPLKRRYESSGTANSSDALKKIDQSCSRFKRDTSPSNNENIPEKTSLCDTKKKSGKRIRHICGGALETKKPVGKQAKRKMNVEEKNVLKSNTSCYCSKMHEYCKTEHLKPKQNEQKCTKLSNEQSKNTRYLAEHVNNEKSDSKVKFSKHPKTQEETEMLDVCLKCMDKARCLLNYSPQSLFLRRMKQRLQNQPLSEDNVKISQICNCDNNRTCTYYSECVQSPSPNSDVHVCCPVNDNQIGYKDNAQDQKCNVHLASGDIVNKVCCCCLSKQTDHKDAQFQTSKHLIDTSTQVAHQEHSVKKKIYKTRTQKYLKTEGSKSQKNIPKKVTSGQRVSSVIRPRKCQCKKQIGGLCCCEVLSSSDRRNDHDLPKDNAVFLDPLKSSVSAPAVSSVKPSIHSHAKQDFSESDESESEQPQLRVPKDISAGYDVFAALAENNHRKYADDPCTYQLEELSNFRQKHWFDCHAHPHGTTPDSKDQQYPISFFDDDLMQPSLDPCVRAYCLNQRLFPEVIKESHSAGCCASQQGNCVSHRLLPTQRRLVTLPSVPHQYGKEASATLKIPPGIETFPQSNILICDPRRMGSAPIKSCSAVESPCRLRRPVPSNSLALRFQKGVV